MLSFSLSPSRRSLVAVSSRWERRGYSRLPNPLYIGTGYRNYGTSVRIESHGHANWNPAWGVAGGGWTDPGGVFASGDSGRARGRGTGGSCDPARVGGYARAHQ